MIYVVEDDRGIRELECYALSQAGFEAAGFEMGSAFWKAVEEKLPELVLLDVMLPGEDGYTLLRKFRQDARTRKIPVIMVTAKGEEMDKVQGLDGGADDFIVKPFGVMELLSRVKAVLRRAQPTEEKRLQSGAMELDIARHTVSVCGEAVSLTHMEFQLLAYLLKNAGIVMTRERLLDAVWSMDYIGDTRTVDVHIRTLRQKLGPCGEHIQTVRGVGYRWET